MSRMSLQEHIELGNMLKVLRSTVQGCLGAFPRNPDISQRCLRLEALIDGLRSRLDDQVCALVPPSMDPRQLATRVYYGALLVRMKTNCRRDAFNGWGLDETR